MFDSLNLITIYFDIYMYFYSSKYTSTNKL